MLVIKIIYKNEIHVYKTNCIKQSYICLKYLFIIVGKHMTHSFQTFFSIIFRIKTFVKILFTLNSI